MQMPKHILQVAVNRTFNRLLDYVDSDEMISTSQIAKEAGVKVQNIETADMMVIQYNVEKMAKAKGITLDSSYADGLFVGTRYEVPFKAIKG